MNIAGHMSKYSQPGASIPVYDVMGFSIYKLMLVLERQIVCNVMEIGRAHV